MSETLEQNPPMAPTEETAPIGENAAAEAPADYAKLHQKEQEKRATMERKFDQQFAEIKALIAAGGTAKQVEAKTDRLQTMLEKAKAINEYAPGLSDLVGELTEEIKTLRSRPDDSVKVRELESRLEERIAYDEYMGDKTPEFRAAYEKEWEAVQAEAESDGEKITPKEARAAMRRWEKRWFKDNDKTDPPTPKKAAGGGRIVPATTGARQTLTPRSAMQVLQDGKDGNLLGIKM